MPQIRALSHRQIGLVNSGHPGPLLIAIGGMHGNEPAGIEAIQSLVDRLVLGQELRLERGAFLGLSGNMAALAQGRRFIDKDLNRHLFFDRNFEYVSQLHHRAHEDLEAQELMTFVKTSISALRPNEVVLVDLHTTTATGGDFIVVGSDEASQQLAYQFRRPVLLGMTKGLAGTTLHCFNSEFLGLETRALVYEAGQHQEQKSVLRGEQFLIKLLLDLDLVTAPVSCAELEWSPPLLADVPRMVRFAYKCSIPAGGRFTMLPGYENFTPVQAGQLLAYLDGEAVVAPQDGYILMPLYQEQGSDGFFIVEAVCDS